MTNGTRSTRGGNAPGVKLGVIGCGAITESFYAPALRQFEEEIDRLVFVDPDQERAGVVRAAVGRGEEAADYEPHLAELDAAIVAAPPALHHPIVSDLIDHGVHVLCEKPLTLDPEDAEDVTEKAESSGVLLAVNQTRRLFPSYQRVRELIESGAIGELVRLEYHEGGPFGWPAVSPSYFQGDRGVLLDRGAHVLDLLCWWMDGEPDGFEYRDDSFGGTEAVAHLRFTKGKVEGEVWLSWLGKRSNRYVVEGTDGVIEGDVYDRNVIQWAKRQGKPRTISGPKQVKSFEELGLTLVGNFLDAVVTGDASGIIQGREVQPSLNLMAKCYEQRQRFQLPWYTSGLTERISFAE